MNVSQIGSNLIMPPWSGGNKINESQGNFDSFLKSSMMNSHDSVTVNQQSMLSGIIPDFSQLKDISTMSNAEFKDMLTSIQSTMEANGVNMNGIPDISQMSDSEFSELKSHMEERHDQMQNMIAGGGIFGIGNIYGSSETNSMQLFLDMLSSVTSSGNEDDELVPQFQLPQIGGSFMSASDYLSLRQMMQSIKV